jgi:vesicle transport through interaction with t-SNAREs 1
MEIECQGIPQSLKQTYQARLRTAKSELASHKKLSKDASSQIARADLLSHRNGGGASPSLEDGSSDDPYSSTSDRSRLLAGTSMLEEGTRRLQESQRLALETENVGGDILRNLHQQREQIVNSRDRVWCFSLA